MRMKILLPTVIAALLATISVASHLRLDAVSAKSTENAAPLLPNAQALRLASAGYESAFADLYWLDSIQYLGSRFSERADLQYFFDRLNLVTDLDPKFAYAYQVGGTVLTFAHRFDESIRLLEKGQSSVPARWQLPFLQAFNYWNGLGDFKSAAALMERAARLPGSPRYLASLAARLYASGDDLDTAEAFLTSMLSTVAPGTQQRAELQERLQDLQVEKALRAIEAAIGQFRVEQGYPPSSLADLEQSHPYWADWLQGIEVQYNPITATIESPQLPRRLRIGE